MNDGSLRVLVTGGAGYIGSSIVRRLVAVGHQPTVLDVRQCDEDALTGSPVLQADVRDRDAVTRLMRDVRPDAVIHVAGIKSVAESMRHPERYFSTNTTGTLSVLEAMVAAGVRQLIFSSSAAVYGAGVEPPVTEEARATPDNPYGESKLQAERLLPWFNRAHGIRFLALRYFNAAGASSDGRFGENWTDAVNLVPVAMRAAATGHPMSIYGSDWPTPDGTAIRDYIHVEDLSEGHVAALDALRRGVESTVVNLGTGTGVSVREVLTTVERVAGRHVPADTVGRRHGDPAAVWADVARARQLLGWKSQRGLSETVADAWRYYVHSGAAPARPTN